MEGENASQNLFLLIENAVQLDQTIFKWLI